VLCARVIRQQGDRPLQRGQRILALRPVCDPPAMPEHAGIRMLLDAVAGFWFPDPHSVPARASSASSPMAAAPVRLPALVLRGTVTISFIPNALVR